MDVAVAKRLEHLEMGLRIADDYSIRNGECTLVNDVTPTFKK